MKNVPSQLSGTALWADFRVIAFVVLGMIAFVAVVAVLAFIVSVVLSAAVYAVRSLNTFWLGVPLFLVLTGLGYGWSCVLGAIGSGGLAIFTDLYRIRDERLSKLPTPKP